jgi:hypothetical protein
MTGTIHAAAVKVPAYCSGWAHTITPAQWTQCWKLGWNQPTTTAANAGYYTGHNIVPILAVVVVAFLVFAWLRGSRRRTAAAPRPARRERAGARR